MTDAVLRIGSFFTGTGGLDMAAEAAFGATTAWVSDIDKGACKILAHRYPDVPNLGDITSIDWSTVEPVDIITGGSPCQDLSHAGKRAGMTDGTRSNLWVAMREAIAELEPTYVIWENVRGAYSAAADSAVVPGGRLLARAGARGTHLRALGRVLGDLSELGYDTVWHGLRAADVGAPHGRFRVFVIARLADAERGGRKRIGATQLSGSPVDPSGDGSRTAAADAAGDGRDEGRAESARLVGRPDAAFGDHAADGLTLLGTPTARMWKGSGPVGSASHDWLLEHGNVEAQVLLLPTPAVNDMGKAYTPDEWDAWTEKMKAAHGNGNGHGKSLEIEAARLLPTPTAQTQSKSRRAMSASRENGRRSGGGQSSPLGLAEVSALMAGERPVHLPDDEDLPPESRRIVEDLRHPGEAFGQYTPAVRRWEAATGMSAPAPTEPTGKGGAHRLSPRFTEWMMGLPPGWITGVPGITRNEALKACGNGVVPQQAYAAITHALDTFELLDRRAA